MATDPAAGRCRASSPIDDAANRQATIATITDNGSAPPAKPAPAGIEAAMAAPGAIAVMLWNNTSRSPMAPRRRPSGSCLCSVRPVMRAPHEEKV